MWSEGSSELFLIAGFGGVEPLVMTPRQTAVLMPERKHLRATVGSTGSLLTGSSVLFPGGAHGVPHI